MPYLWGVLLAFAVAALAVVTRLDRGEAFFPTVLIVIASYYGLFAVMGGPEFALGAELGAFALLTLVAILGFKSTPWLIVAALVGHGMFDMAHHHLIANPGVPSWWPAFCFAFDWTFAAYLAVRLKRHGSDQKSNRAVTLTSRPASGA